MFHNIFPQNSSSLRSADTLPNDRLPKSSKLVSVWLRVSNFYFKILRSFKIFNNEMYMYTISVKNFKTPCFSCINYFLWKNYLCRRSNNLLEKKKINPIIL